MHLLGVPFFWLLLCATVSLVCSSFVWLCSRFVWMCSRILGGVQDFDGTARFLSVDRPLSHRSHFAPELAQMTPKKPKRAFRMVHGDNSTRRPPREKRDRRKNEICGGRGGEQRAKFGATLGASHPPSLLTLSGLQLFRGLGRHPFGGPHYLRGSTHSPWHIASSPPSFLSTHQQKNDAQHKKTCNHSKTMGKQTINEKRPIHVKTTQIFLYIKNTNFCHVGCDRDSPAKAWKCMVHTANARWMLRAS